MGFFSKVPKEKEREQRRFYLLPGMGGRALRRKQQLILRWSIIAGLLVSAVLAALLFFISTMRH